MLGRKAAAVDSSGAPRTPFAAVNRQSAYMTDASNLSQKSGQVQTKHRGKRHSWAHEYQISSKSAHQKGQHDNEASLTPVRTKGLREKSLRKQIIEMKGSGQLAEEEQGTQHRQESGPGDGHDGGAALSCTLPPSPVLYLPSTEISGRCNPTGSVSCPEVFTRTCTQQPVLASAPQEPLPSSVEAKPLPSALKTSEAESEKEACAELSVIMSPGLESGTSGGAEVKNASGSDAVAELSGVATVDAVISSYESEDGTIVISEDVQTKVVCVEEGPEGFAAWTDDSVQLSTSVSADMVKEVANTAARLILEELVTGIMDGIAKGDTLLPPERSIRGHSCSDAVAPSAEEACEDASVEGGIDFPAEASGQSSYMAEYSKFIASYIRESDKIGAQLTSKELRGLAVGCSDQSSDSQSASGATSETDVTSSSLVSDADVDQNSSGNMCESRVVLDSLGSFLFEADDSVSSHGTPMSRGSGSVRETPKSSRYESQGYVRSSVSRFDLTREYEDTPSPWKSQSEESEDQNESLNLSVAQQKVAYFVSPSFTAAAEDSALAQPGKISDAKTTQVEINTVGLSPIVVPVDIVTEHIETADADTMTQGVDVISIALSPLPLSVRDSETATDVLETTDANVMTLSVDVNSVALSPLAVSVREKGVTTDAVEMTHADTMTLGIDMSSIALSPIAVSVREKQTETDETETADVDTMTLRIHTSEIALSPMAVAVHNKDTMTANPEKTEVAMATEMVECLDTSMLATAEMSSKTTMTDSEGRCNAHTSMTPLKALTKHGHRLTSDDVRKQHPRTLANQLETLNVCNSRLESELKSAQQEQSQLKSALKHAKASEAGARKELAALELEKEREWAEKESHYQEQVSELGQLAAERVGFISALELEVSEMREALEAATTRHAKEVADLEAKCQAIEEHRFQAAQQYEQELEELRRDQETNTYRRQFELAQQLVREREAELVELRAVFVDLQDTAHRQEQVNDAFQGIHDKVMALARENKQLKEALHKQRMLSQEERGRQQVHVSALEEENKSLVQEADSLKHTMELNNGTLSELEKLYAGASSDLLTATGQVIQLNSELFGARKAMQELLLTKEGLAKRANELQDELDVVRQEHAALSETLTQAQEQLEQQTKTCEDLQKLNTRIKKMYEEKFENLELGIENLQRTLDNRELDIDTLEKDLYECRNIIVEQRYKIDGLESELREVREEAAKKQSNDDDVQFFKESNALLEAERSLYVDSLRDLEEKLKKASLEVGRQQQMAADAQCLVTQLEREKNRLQSQLAQTQNQLSQSSHALATFEAEHAQVESVAVAAAGELLQKMQTVLNGLKKKIGMQEMPDASAPPAYQRRRSQVSAKHKRNVRKSFVSKILGAACTSSPVKMGMDSDLTQRNPSDGDKHNTSDAVAVMNASGDATGTGASLFAVLDSLSPNKVERRGVDQGSVANDLSFRGMGLTASDLAMAYSLTRDDASMSAPASTQKSLFKNFDSVSVHSQSRPGPALMGPVPRLAPSQSSAFTAVPCSATSASTRLNMSLPHPPAHPPSSSVAKIRTLPRTDRRSAPVHYAAADRGDGTEENIMSVGESAILTCILSLDETFVDISRLASILERATQLSLQDLREENDVLRERSVILEDEVDRSRAEIDVSRQESNKLESTISQLQAGNRQMAERLMALTDHKFEVKRLSGEVKRLEGEVDAQRREKEVLAGELETLLRRLETSSSSDGSTVQARCVRDIIALKKKNQNLLTQLADQKDHYEELGRKAARRMRVLEENWKKAEDEVYRFDELVENIRRVRVTSSFASDLILPAS
ncbi:hypothetical protein BaRGS_00023320 [Batillaria attramentaria]|uniref:Pericentrin/AKAP-450 centrosomal targeting domain-containing protein n=1 Tax=Batillaria attramentaria TaxID=370345 RepID=A0ABD0KED7_9CAEN